VAARVTRSQCKTGGGGARGFEGKLEYTLVVRGRDEVGQLAQSFNQMTQTASGPARAADSGRARGGVAGSGRRLAHELKNPLFPLQTTVENLQRASSQNPNNLKKFFASPPASCFSEIENLKAIVGRFSDFAKMPQPELGPVDLNTIVRNVEKLFERNSARWGVRRSRLNFI